MASHHKNILFISYDGMTDPLGQSQVLPYIIGLSKLGYQFTILSCEKKERFLQQKKRIEDICSKNKIDWQPISYSKNPPILSTIWDIFKLFWKSKALHRKKKFEVLHCRSYIAALVGLKFKTKYNTKFLFDMRGFWANERVDGNVWNLDNPIYRIVYNFFKRKEKEFLIHANKVISLTNAGKNELLNWDIEQLNDEKVEVIPCTADYNVFNISTPEKQKQAKINLGLEPKQFVLSYIGSIGTWYMIDEMFHFFSVLKKTKPDAKFLMLTAEKKETIFPIAQRYRIKPEDLIIKFVARENIPEYAHASDFSIFFIQPLFSKKASSPTKMGELMAMGIPLICNANVGDVQSIMETTNGGICIEQLDENAYENVVHELTNSHWKSPEKLREASKKFYDLQNGLNLYAKTYQEIID